MKRNETNSIINKGLFSDDYLVSRLPKRTDWQHMAPHREILDDVKEIFEKAGTLVNSANETQVRHEIVSKVLELINPFFLSDQRLSTGGAPDYVFFEKAESKMVKDLDAIIAVGDAKEPGKDFEKAVQERSPVRQVYDYMADTQTKWGLLTDGRRWRLLNHDSPTNRFLEIDLYDVVMREDSDEWLYFYNLFRREAFVPVKGVCFLDLVKTQSEKYAQEVGEELTGRVYKALRELAQGFFAWPDNKLDSSIADERDLVRRSCFILLYRLLFIFFAEARGLLPKDADGYRDLSLESIREHVKGASRTGTRFHSDSRRLWAALKDLFRLIDQGNLDLGIPPYDGGLFSRESGRLDYVDFLQGNHISDRYLAGAIDLLGTSSNPDNKDEYVNVDYAGLEIRHLGSIYERLLEFRLAYAESNLVSVKKGGAEIWVDTADYDGKTPLEDLPSDRMAAEGELFLETKNHERKTTGSYYTPDYIVKYIVKNTIGPIVEERTRSSIDNNRKISNEILKIRVLDPAMGSGHFLVEATEFLADALLDAVEKDVKRKLQPPVESSLEWAKREVVRHCIYGVDLNDLAVELSKVSLWLSTVSADKPLSFLNHRLKCGNSLIGARMSALRDHPKLKGRKQKKTVETSIPSFISEIYIDELIGKIKELDALSDDNPKNIRRKEQVLEEFRHLPEYSKVKAIADVHTSIYFGNKVPSTKKKSPKEVFYDLIYSLDYPSNWEEKTRTTWFKEGTRTAHEKRFFHWELEYPDVFFEEGKERENPGFDVAIGNPPYVRIYRGALDREDIDFWKERFNSAHMKFDLYVLFMDLSLDLTRDGGRFSMIVPDKFMNTPYGGPIRSKILKDTRVESFLDLRGVKVFEDASVANVIPVLKKGDPRDSQFSVLKYADGGFQESNRIPQQTVISDMDGIFRLSVTASDLGIVSKIIKESITLDRVYYVNWGLRTGTKEKTRTYVVNTPGQPLSHPMIRGENVAGRYDLSKPKEYIIYDKDELYNPMFEEFFENSKIVFRKISGIEGILAAYDDQKYYCFSTLIPCVHIKDVHHIARPGIPQITPESEEYTSHYYFLANVNSRLVRWFYDKMLSDRLSVVPNHVKQLPVRRIQFTTPPDTRGEMVAKAMEEYSDHLVSGDQTGVLSFVNDCLPRTENGVLIEGEEKSDVVHDLLSNLARELTEMFRQKNEEIGDFLEWFEWETRAKISDIENRTQLLSYYELPYDEFIDIIMENKRTIPVNLSDKKFRRKLRERFEKSVSKIVPLVREAKATDRLIDLIVYRMYGLSEDQMKIVEKHAK
ncbi:MAG: Eco57I restriction-modification methylase domain-containing protein [Candidatus Thorarchaeota archaeon]|jgi:type I restriction-modification system DNA methylase subunit